MKGKTLELFAGSCSFSKVAKEYGYKTFTSDNTQYGSIDYVEDIMRFDYKKIPYIPDIIWASPPCTGFSVASIGHHWTGGKGAYIPKTDTARLGILLVQRTIQIIEHYQYLNPNLIWYIENPRGILRKMPFMEELPIRNTITYCQYNNPLIQQLIFNMKNKKCPKCGEIKYIGNFYKNVSRKDGFTSYCKDCIKQDSKIYIKKTLPARLAYQNKYRGENREMVREKETIYREKNRELHRDKDKRYRENNPEKIKDKMKKYRAENVDYHLNKSRERRLLKKGVSDGSVTLKFEKELLILQNNKCGYCNEELSKKHLDHIIPLSRGGEHTKTNVHWTCPKCNLSKNNKTEEEWLQKERMKPSDIWTNNKTWTPRPMCKNGQPCHVSAPRGSRTGTQGLKNNHERSKIPADLFKELLINPTGE